MGTMTTEQAIARVAGWVQDLADLPPPSSKKDDVGFSGVTDSPLRAYLGQIQAADGPENVPLESHFAAASYLREHSRTQIGQVAWQEAFDTLREAFLGKLTKIDAKHPGSRAVAKARAYGTAATESDDAQEIDAGEKSSREKASPEEKAARIILRTKGSAEGGVAGRDGSWKFNAENTWVELQTARRRKSALSNAIMAKLGLERGRDFHWRVEEHGMEKTFTLCVKPHAIPKLADYMEDGWPLLAAALRAYLPVWEAEAGPPPEENGANGNGAAVAAFNGTAEDGRVGGFRWRWTKEDPDTLQLGIGKDLAFAIKTPSTTVKETLPNGSVVWWRAYRLEDLDQLEAELIEHGAGKFSAVFDAFRATWLRREAVTDDAMKRARNLVRRFKFMVHPDVRNDEDKLETTLAKVGPLLQRVKPGDTEVDLGAYGKFKVVPEKAGGPIDKNADLRVYMPFALKEWSSGLRHAKKRKDERSVWHDVLPITRAPEAARKLDLFSPPLALAIRIALLTETLRECFELEELAGAIKLDDIADATVRAEAEAAVAKAYAGMAQGVKMYPYQEVGVAFAALSGYKALIGDAMGLGKSVQALACLAGEPEELTPALIIAPASVTYNWIREGNRWTPGLRFQAIGSATDLRKLKTGDVGIVSWGAVSNLFERLDQVHFKTMVSDECFPAGTLVATPWGQIPIEQIAVGDFVLSCDVTTGEITRQMITRSYARPRKTYKVRVTHALGSFECTNNHKVWTTGAGLVEAGRLVGHQLRVLRKSGDCALVEQQSASVLRSLVLSEVAEQAGGSYRAEPRDRKATGAHPSGSTASGFCGAHADGEPDDFGGNSGEGFGYSAFDGAWAGYPGREWASTLGTATSSGGSHGASAGACCAGAEGTSADHGDSSASQDRSGGSNSNVGCGGGRVQSRGSSAQGAGFSEGLDLVESGVVHVEVLESGGFGGLDFGGSADQELVYDLEVEGTHKYFANDVLVSNSHYAKNPKAARTKSVIQLATSIPHRLLLSGTAMENRPEELWAQLHIVAPEVFPDGKEFKAKFGSTTKRRVGNIDYFDDRALLADAEDDEGGGGAAGVGASALVLAELRETLRCFMVRRLKAEVLTDLPEKTRQYIWNPLPDKVQAAYNAVNDNMEAWLCSIWRRKALLQAVALVEGGVAVPKAVAQLNEAAKDVGGAAGQVLVALGHLRRIVGEAKAAVAVDWILDFLEQSDDPLVVFVEHQKPLKAIEAALTDAGVSWSFIDGSVPPKERAKRVADFQAGAYRVFLGTRAMAEGVTMTRAADGLFVERWWVPSKEEQAEDRLHRIGQKNAVNWRYLMAPGTIDEHIAELVDAKRQLIEMVMRGEGTEELNERGVGGDQSDVSKSLVAQIMNRMLIESGGCQITEKEVHDAIRGKLPDETELIGSMGEGDEPHYDEVEDKPAEPLASPAEGSGADGLVADYIELRGRVSEVRPDCVEKYDTMQTAVMRTMSAVRSEFEAPKGQKAVREEGPLTFVQFMQAELDREYAERHAKLAEQEQYVIGYEATRAGAKPLPVGISPVQAFLSRTSRGTAEKNLRYEYDTAKKEMDTLTSGDWLKEKLRSGANGLGHAQQVYARIHKRQPTVQEEAAARKLVPSEMEVPGRPDAEDQEFERSRERDEDERDDDSEIPSGEQEPVDTVELHGKLVLAKPYHGKLSAMTFANRTQAQKWVDRLGAPWWIAQWGRPFFVVREKPADETGRVLAQGSSVEKPSAERLTQYATERFAQANEMGEDAHDRALILAMSVGKQAARWGLSPDEVSKWLQAAYGQIWVRLGGLNPGADLKEIRSTILRAMAAPQRPREPDNGSVTPESSVSTDDKGITVREVPIASRRPGSEWVASTPAGEAAFGKTPEAAKRTLLESLSASDSPRDGANTHRMTGADVPSSGRAFSGMPRGPGSPPLEREQRPVTRKYNQETRREYLVYSDTGEPVPPEVHTFTGGTLYTEGAFGISRTEVKDITFKVGIYAQYDFAMAVTFVPKGKRKEVGRWITPRDFVAFVPAGIPAPDPEAPWGATETTATGLTSRQTRYASFDPRWVSDFEPRLPSGTWRWNGRHFEET